MGQVSFGINLEFVRRDDKPFEWGAMKAAELGYGYVEPMLHWGRELLSEAGYFHSASMLDNPLRLSRACEKYGVRLSGVSAHTPLCKPEVSTEYLKQAIRFAAEAHAPVVNTDEGPKPDWTIEEEDHVLMRYVLQEAAKVAEPRGLLIGLEPHQQYSKSPAGLRRIVDLVDSPVIGINYDTGNSYLAGIGFRSTAISRRKALPPIWKPLRGSASVACCIWKWTRARRKGQRILQVPCGESCSSTLAGKHTGSVWRST